MTSFRSLQVLNNLRPTYAGNIYLEFKAAGLVSTPQEFVTALAERPDEVDLRALKGKIPALYPDQRWSWIYGLHRKYGGRSAVPESCLSVLGPILRKEVSDDRIQSAAYFLAVARAYVTSGLPGATIGVPPPSSLRLTETKHRSELPMLVGLLVPSRLETLKRFWDERYWKFLDQIVHVDSEWGYNDLLRNICEDPESETATAALIGLFLALIEIAPHAKECLIELSAKLFYRDQGGLFVASEVSRLFHETHTKPRDDRSALFQERATTAIDRARSNGISVAGASSHGIELAEVALVLGGMGVNLQGEDTRSLLPGYVRFEVPGLDEATRSGMSNYAELKMLRIMVDNSVSPSGGASRRHDEVMQRALLTALDNGNLLHALIEGAISDPRELVGLVEEILAFVEGDEGAERGRREGRRRYLHQILLNIRQPVPGEDTAVLFGRYLEVTDEEFQYPGLAKLLGEIEQDVALRGESRLSLVGHFQGPLNSLRSALERERLEFCEGLDVFSFASYRTLRIGRPGTVRVDPQRPSFETIEEIARSLGYFEALKGQPLANEVTVPRMIANTIETGRLLELVLDQCVDSEVKGLLDRLITVSLQVAWRKALRDGQIEQRHLDYLWRLRSNFDRLEGGYLRREVLEEGLVEILR